MVGTKATPLLISLKIEIFSEASLILPLPQLKKMSKNSAHFNPLIEIQEKDSASVQWAGRQLGS